MSDSLTAVPAIAPKMSRALLCLLAVAATTLAAPCLSAVSAAEPFSVRWERTLSGPSNEDEIDGVAAGDDRSAFVTGKFEGTATLGGRTLTSAGRADIPLARFGPSGRPKWVKRFGGPGEDNLFDVSSAPGGGAVATGIYSGEVRFGPETLTSSGPSDCVVLSIGNTGRVRWARSIGGPGRDGCNEVATDDDGNIVTSVDTEGGWRPRGNPALGRNGSTETVLVRLGPRGAISWMRAVTGPGNQRGKAIGVAPNGAVTFGGDSAGPLDVFGRTVPAPGARRDAWISRFSAGGSLKWATSWGGPGNDLAKGVVDTGEAVYVVGPFTGEVTIGGAPLTAGPGTHIALARLDPGGQTEWATSASAPVGLDGAELVSAPGGGVLFGGGSAPGLQFGQASGASVALDETGGGTGWLAHYDARGHVAFAATVPGTASGRLGEIARRGDRVYVDVVLRGPDNTVNGEPIAVQGKDAGLWSLDLSDTTRVPGDGPR